MEQLEIFVESLTGSLLQFQVSPFETVLSLKEKIQNLQGIPVSHQHLIHQDRELDNDLSLYNYNIQNGSTLRLILHMRGGPISTRPLTADLTQQTLLEEMATEYMESLTGENWPTSGADGGGSVASGGSGDSETQTDARAPSTASASPTPVPPSSQPHPRHVTLLVLRDGDQLNFYRVVDRSTSCVVPNGSSIAAPFDALVSPSGSAIGDDQSSAASEATLNGSASCVEASLQSFNTSKDNHPEQRVYDQHVVEDKTRQKMAELRSRLMANNKQVQIAAPRNSGAGVVSGLNTTPVLMPRPPSTAVQRANASRNSVIQDGAPRPYVPTAMSGLRRRRMPNQQSLPVASTPPKGAIGSPHDQLHASNNNFASLADYFRSKEEISNGASDGNFAQDSSPSPLPSPLHKNGNIKLPAHIPPTERRQSQTQQDIVRCSPYLRELFAGTRFFVMDQDQKEGEASSSSTNDTSASSTQPPPKSSPMQLKSINKSAVEPSYEHLVGESVVQQQRFGEAMTAQNQQPSTSKIHQGSTVPSRTASRQQQPTTRQTGGLANAFAALIERQTSQTANQQPPVVAGNSSSSKKQAGMGTTNAIRPQPGGVAPSANAADPDEDVDVLERALTTLLLKAELEHLGSSRLPVGLIQPPTSSNDIMMPKDSRAASRHMPPTPSTRFGGGAGNTTASRQQQSSSFALGNPLTNRVPTSNKLLSSTNGEVKKQQHPVLEIVPPSTSSSLSTTTKLPAIAPPPQSQVRAVPPAAPITRCAVCNRRTGLATTYICRCSATFCTVHRYPETHQCTYDYKGEGRRAIQANNPVITADKLPKI